MLPLQMLKQQFEVSSQIESPEQVHRMHNDHLAPKNSSKLCEVAEVVAVDVVLHQKSSKKPPCR
jgi:hypothetical protein